MLTMRRGVVAVVVASLLAMLGAGLTWVSTVAGPMPRAIAALNSGNGVQVERGPWLAFHPADRQPETGLVFYPGSRVDPRAYAPAAREIAGDGYLVVVVPMPLNLAVLAPDGAADVMAAYPAVRSWAVGGHSLGGAMAAHFARSHPDGVAGLLLWAAHPYASDDLSDRSLLEVVSVFGTLDGIVTVETIDSYRPLLPASTRWEAIKGGNHAQFGWYGAHSGDREAEIGREEQQGQVVAASLGLMRKLSNGHR